MYSLLHLLLLLSLWGTHFKNLCEGYILFYYLSMRFQDFWHAYKWDFWQSSQSGFWKMYHAILTIEIKIFTNKHDDMPVEHIWICFESHMLTIEQPSLNWEKARLKIRSWSPSLFLTQQGLSLMSYFGKVKVFNPNYNSN